MANIYLEPVPVRAHSITRTGIKLCSYQYWHFGTFVQYQYWHGPLPVLALNGASTGIGIFAVLSNTSIGTVHYQYCHYLVPVPVLAIWYFCPISVLARYIAVTCIKWCQYWCWHICSFVQYQYWHGTLPVPPLLGAPTGIGIMVLWFIISIGTVHYRYWHLTVPVPVMAFMHLGPLPVSAWYITVTGIEWC